MSDTAFYPLTPIVWYHEKEKAKKLVPDPFLILVNIPKDPLHARNSFIEKPLIFFSFKLNSF